jgi:AbrB family looped-hinge helix DNA binding protein
MPCWTSPCGEEENPPCCAPLAFSLRKEYKGNKDSKEGFMDLEMTKMTAKGQITLPTAIRKSLGLNPGDKVGFIMDSGGIRVVNVSSLRFGVRADHVAEVAAHEQKETPL